MFSPTTTVCKHQKFAKYSVCKNAQAHVSSNEAESAGNQRFITNKHTHMCWPLWIREGMKWERTKMFSISVKKWSEYWMLMAFQYLVSYVSELWLRKLEVIVRRYPLLVSPNMPDLIHYIFIPWQRTSRMGLMMLNIQGIDFLYTSRGKLSVREDLESSPFYWARVSVRVKLLLLPICWAANLMQAYRWSACVHCSCQTHAQRYKPLL